MSQQPQSRVAPDVHPDGGGIVNNEEREYIAFPPNNPNIPIPMR